jgi:predicted regulator of Ras-like GTPase activity (Roadblock/LC7/MglB family)
MTKADRLSTALDDFLTISPEVEAAAVVSADGLPMASALPPHVEEDRLAAMSAALLTLGERAASELGKGDLAQIFIEGPKGHVILMAAGRDCVLVCVTARGAKVGLVLFEMRRIAERVARVMEDAEPRTPFDVLSDSAAPAEPPATPVASWQ